MDMGWRSRRALRLSILVSVCLTMHTLLTVLHGQVTPTAPHQAQLTILHQALLSLPHQDQPPAPYQSPPSLRPAELETGKAEADDLIRTLHGVVHQNLTEEGQLEVDLEGGRWRLWQADLERGPCANYETRFGHDLARVQLVSHPCSGNTWLRYLLEAATGLFTGSIYNDTELVKAGYLGETEDKDSGRTLVQKTHASTHWSMDPADLLMRYTRLQPHHPAVLLTRDPARSIICYWKLIVSSYEERHTAQIPDNLYKTPDFHDFVEESVARWEELVSDRLLWSEAPVYVVHYEHLLQNTTLHLLPLLAFLGVPVDAERVACLASRLDGSFRRRGNKDFDPFTEQEKFLMRAAATRVNRTLAALDYPALPSYPATL